MVSSLRVTRQTLEESLQPTVESGSMDGDRESDGVQ